MKIKFYAGNNEFNDALNEYILIWEKEGKNIVQTIENMSGLRFKSDVVEAEVFEGVSTSHPLRLRASYPNDVKKATLIHELFHILFVDNDIKIKGGSFEIHKNMFIFLYDVWLKLYGEEFTKKMIKVESERTEMYKKAWDWAVSKK